MPQLHSPRIPYIAFVEPCFLLSILKANLRPSFAQQNYLIVPLTSQSLHFLRQTIQFPFYAETPSSPSMLSRIIVQLHSSQNSYILFVEAYLLFSIPKANLCSRSAQQNYPIAPFSPKLLRFFVESYILIFILRSHVSLSSVQQTIPQLHSTKKLYIPFVKPYIWLFLSKANLCSNSA